MAQKQPAAIFYLLPRRRLFQYSTPSRAAGHGKKAAFYEFLKGAKTGEAKSLAALGVEFYCPVEREKFTWTMTEEEKAECRVRQADTLARAAAHMAEYDLVVLDEVLCAVNAGMLSLADVLRTVREKAPNTELVLTGRGAPEELIALADYVSVIEARQHPIQKRSYSVRHPVLLHLLR